MKRPHFLAAVVISTMLLAGCTARSDDAKTADSSKPGKMPEELEPIKNDPPADCPVTVSGGPSFEAPAPYAPAAPWPNIFWFGSESLWTALQANGVWEACHTIPRDTPKRSCGGAACTLCRTNRNLPWSSPDKDWMPPRLRSSFMVRQMRPRRTLGKLC